MANIRRILVATDFTATSNLALDWAIELAAPLGASVTVIHAYEIPVIGFPDGALIATSEVAARISTAARAALDSVVEQREGRGVPLTSKLREGVAWEEINAVADEMDADLIVLGTHGRRGIARALLGSVADKVIRTSHRPVTTLHGGPSTADPAR
jgi:nucleotide-binding universal stress UspA family protein